MLGGDFNIRQLALDGFACAGGHDVDYVFVRGLSAASGAEVLDRGRLSDHAPVAVTLGRRVTTDYWFRLALSPNPRSISSAFSPSVPRAGRTPSWVATS